ncbi:hypothetical protein AA909_13020 [Vibrio anguillarum]|nr:hypothetical protein AA909_13020 [Vibrio anguillarum]
MDLLEESGWSKLAKEERNGPGGKPSSQKFPCRDQERKLEVRRRSDTARVLTINDANQQSVGVTPMTRRAASGKPKSLGSGGSMVAKLKLKGIDGRAPPGVEPAA